MALPSGRPVLSNRMQTLISTGENAPANASTLRLIRRFSMDVRSDYLTTPVGVSSPDGGPVTDGRAAAALLSEAIAVAIQRVSGKCSRINILIPIVIGRARKAPIGPSTQPQKNAAMMVTTVERSRPWPR